MYTFLIVAKQKVIRIIAIPKRQFITREAHIITNGHFFRMIKKCSESILAVNVESFFTFCTRIGFCGKKIRLISHRPRIDATSRLTKQTSWMFPI